MLAMAKSSKNQPDLICFLAHSRGLKRSDPLVRFLACPLQLTKNPLEPLLICIAREFSDNQDLSEKIQTVYQAGRGEAGLGEGVKGATESNHDGKMFNLIQVVQGS